MFVLTYTWAQPETICCIQTPSSRTLVFLQVQLLMLPAATGGPGKQPPATVPSIGDQLSTIAGFVDSLHMCVAVQYN